MPKIRLITFDLDDTLWEMTPVLIEAERCVREWLEAHAPRMAHAWDRDALSRLRAEIVRDNPALAHRFSEMRVRVIREALLRSGYPDTRSDTLARDAFEVFTRARNNVQLFDGVLATLETLGRRFVLGALSNGNADVRRIGLDAHFRFHFSAETHGPPKPDPAMFRAALDWAGVDAHEAVHVGDHPGHDVAGAVGAGLHAILVAPSPPASGPHVAAIRSLRDLPDAVDALIAAP